MYIFVFYEVMLRQWQCTRMKMNKRTLKDDSVLVRPCSLWWKEQWYRNTSRWQLISCRSSLCLFLSFPLSSPADTSTPSCESLLPETGIPERKKRAPSHDAPLPRSHLQSLLTAKYFVCLCVSVFRWVELEYPLAFPLQTCIIVDLAEFKYACSRHDLVHPKVLPKQGQEERNSQLSAEEFQVYQTAYFKFRDFKLSLFLKLFEFLHAADDVYILTGLQN